MLIWGLFRGMISGCGKRGISVYVWTGSPSHPRLMRFDLIGQNVTLGEGAGGGGKGTWRSWEPAGGEWATWGRGCGGVVGRSVATSGRE